MTIGEEKADSKGGVKGKWAHMRCCNVVVTFNKQRKGGNGIQTRWDMVCGGEVEGNWNSNISKWILVSEGGRIDGCIRSSTARGLGLQILTRTSRARTSSRSGWSANTSSLRVPTSKEVQKKAKESKRWRKGRKEREKKSNQWADMEREDVQNLRCTAATGLFVTIACF